MATTAKIAKELKTPKFKIRLRMKVGTNVVIIRSARTGKRLARGTFRVAKPAAGTTAPTGTGGPTHADPPFGDPTAA